MIPTDDYPRPQLRRSGATSLDGEWQFALDPDGRWTTPNQITWDRGIVVPFAPETPLSGVGETGFMRACWYRRGLEPVALGDGERLMLRFGAVDERSTVWVNGRRAGTHEGGYTPFGVDITEAAQAGGPLDIVVRAEDDPHDLAKPRGKQDWRREPHAIWYPRTTGIWQSVWLERLPRTSIETLRWLPNVERWEIGLEVLFGGRQRDDLVLEVELSVGEDASRRILAKDEYAVSGGEVRRVIQLPDPGIDDARRDLLWSPESPTLIHAQFRLMSPIGDLIDEVFSYTGLRSVAVEGDRFLLNGRPFPLRLVLDQGYWPESGLTAPESAALRRDIELTLAMGFNGVRKHQKIEDPRYLYWADRLGLLVWEELPSAYQFRRETLPRLIQTWTGAVLRDLSHPSIVAWVPFNESWGVPDLPLDPAQRHAVQTLYHLTKTLDPSRPVVDNDGWESGETDLIGIHDYDHDPERLRERYAGVERRELFRRERLGGRVLRLAGHEDGGQPLILSEFGGIAFTRPEEREQTWGYVRAETAADFEERYARLLAVVRSLPFAGFCYTQFADTYLESNGLLTADRTPKISLESISLATRGPKSPRQIELERRRQLAQAAETEESRVDGVT